MRITLLSEGAIDLHLLPPLIAAIAKKCGVTWPISPEEDNHIHRIRKCGHGGLLEKIKAIASDYHKGIYPRPDILVVVIDRKNTQTVVKKIKSEISALHWCVFGVAVEEIEAWWLGDRQQVLRWLKMSEEQAKEQGYGPDYAPEGDQEPKRTLDALTAASEAISENYSLDGNAHLAQEFVEAAWSQHVNIDAIMFKCSRGFRPFYNGLVPKFQK